MTTTVSVRLDVDTKQRLEALAKSMKRSKSFLAAEAIAAYVETEAWQLGEIREGIKDLDEGRVEDHAKVSRWLSSWGKPGETRAPK